MKKTLAILVVLVAVTGFGYADTVDVLGTSTSPSITPLEGDYSLVVHHDDSSVAYVEDQSPNAETIYRAEFLYNPNDIQATTTAGPWRQMIFRAFSLDSNACTPQTYMNAFMVYDLHWGAIGANCSVIMWGRGNLCGQQATTRVDIPCDQTSRVCIEYKAGSAQTGLLAIAAVDSALPCPTSGDAAWQTKAMTNNSLAIEFVRLGAANTNNFGRGESGDWYMDSFMSYRTVTP